MSILPIKSIQSIQEAATKQVQDVIEAQRIVIGLQSEKITAAERKLNAASDEATKGQTFIDNFNAMFTKAVD